MSLEAVQVKKKRLRDARAQLGLTQSELAKAAGIGRQPIVGAENAMTINALSAWAILNALNRIRSLRGMEPLEFEQIDWKIRGDSEE